MPLIGVTGQGAQLFEHSVVHLVRRERLGRAALRPEFLPGSADVVMVFLVADAAVGRGHGVMAKTTEEQTLEKSIGRVVGMRLTPAVVVEKMLDLVPLVVIDDGLVFADVGFVFMADLAEVSDVGQELVQGALGEGPTATRVALARLPTFGPPSMPVDFLQHPA